MSSVTILTPTGTLGYGFGTEAFDRGMSLQPDVIAVDAGSTDPGPYYLGSGEPLVSRISTKRELTQIITGAREAEIPVIVGSAGGAGTRSHVGWTTEIVREIAHEQNLHLRLAYIYADIPIARVERALAQGEVHDFEAGFTLTQASLDETTSLVAQMGYEPIVDALSDGADVVIAGRCLDDCAIAAYPIFRGGDPGGALHMGKILECGAFSAEPFAMDVMLGFLGTDYFELEPGSPNRRASVASTAAHSLYERENPYLQHGPGHSLDLSQCRFEQMGERRVRVSGGKYADEDSYWVKLEGARRVGFRTICVAGIRCPTMIARIQEILEAVRKGTLAYFGDETLQINYHVYGQNGVMGSLEPQLQTDPYELGVVIEAVASEQSLAHGACHHASGSLLHYSYDGQFNTSGNLALLYSPSDIDAGAVYEFSVYHLMKLDSPSEVFPIHFEEL
jgi:hypothetical protein